MVVRVRRGVVPDRPRDGRDSAFDDAVLDAPGRRDSPPRPALDGRSDLADDFRDSTPGDRRREIGRDDDLGTPSREETDWLSSLPAAIDQELRSLARKAWRATKPEHRGELSRQLSSTSVPDMIRKTLRDWQNGRPVDRPAGDGRDERTALERQIVRSLSGVAGSSDQRMAAEDIEATLGGIPDDIALNVLRDWRTDLRDQKSDRDPREIDGSSLVRRIRRALTRAGISVRSLDSATQDRLRSGELR